MSALRHDAKYFLAQLHSFFRYAENNPEVTVKRVHGGRNLLKLCQEVVEKDDDPDLRAEMEKLVAWINENSPTIEKEPANEPGPTLHRVH